MANGDTKTNQYLDIAANGTRADLPSDTCCETRTQTLIRGVAERVMDVEDEVERLENNPDVADIVATYADLQAYPTSQLTDKDVIRVLQDETHDGESTYYRWSTSTQTWTYIGESKQYTDFVGTDGTAAGEAGLVPAPVATDAGYFLSASGDWEEVAAGGGVVELTAADYNYPVDNPTYVALWLLEPGVYSRASNSVKVRTRSTPSGESDVFNMNIFIIGGDITTSHPMMAIGTDSVKTTILSTNGGGAVGFPKTYVITDLIVDNLTSTYATRPLSANQGKVLKDMIDALPTGGGVTELTSADYNWPTSNPTSVALWLLDNGMYVAESDSVNVSISYNKTGLGNGIALVKQLDNENPSRANVVVLKDDSSAIYYGMTADGRNASQYNLSNPTVVQFAGTSTTDIMSQNAVTRMVFPSGDSGSKIQIGSGASNTGSLGVTIGSGSKTTSSAGVALGANTTAGAANSVAIGRGASTSVGGTVSIGDDTYDTLGYNNSAYRLLTGLYDGQSAHDAVTVGQVNSVIDNLNSALNINIPHIGA